MKVLVTGATGFFGKAIVASLTCAGHEVVGAARHADADIEHVDVASKQSCTLLLSKHHGLDAIVHCAAIAHANEGAFSGEQYQRTNAEGARNLIDAAVACGIGCFIHISTVSVYGEFDLPSPVLETSPVRPLGDYGTSKKAAEDFCQTRRSDIRLYVFRMATMYGADWLFNIRRKVTPPLIGRYLSLTFDGSSARYTLCSNTNGAKAVLWAIEDRLPADTYNVADFCDYSLLDVRRAVETVEGRKWHLNIPRPISALILKSFIWIARSSRARQNAYSRYWKFFEHNLYATDKLKAAGFDAPPHLLDIGSD